MGEHRIMCTRPGALVMVPSGSSLSLGFWLVPLAVVRRCSIGVSYSSNRGLAQVGRYPGAWCVTVVSWHEGVGLSNVAVPGGWWPGVALDRPPCQGSWAASRMLYAVGTRSPGVSCESLLGVLGEGGATVVWL